MLVLAAHHDAVPGSPGANDNAASVAILLHLLGRLERGLPAGLRVRLLFPACEEVGYLGARAWVRDRLPADVVGVLSLENINLSAGLRIPFIGEPLTFSFAFSSRENPFNLTISLLGGGGFFGLELTPKGVRMLEAALEAGARISIDFGVASGSISAMIGIYFRIEQIN